jgi:hypothetical protein
MKVRLLFGVFLSGLLCGCAANTPYSETVIDTSTQTRQTVLPEAPVANRPTFAPGSEGTSASHW